MKMEKIKTVHFGLAHDHSTATLECARKYPDIFEIVGIVEPDEETKRIFGNHPAYQGLPYMTEEELFNRGDIEAVFCEGHELRSVSDAQKCADHGLHIHLDKPGGIDLNAFEKLLCDAQRKDLTLQMGYMYRYNPAMEYTLARVKKGELGLITGIDGSFSICHNSTKRAWLGQFPGGMMFYIGCHVIDMILLLMGAPENVIPYNRSSDWDNNGSMDSSFAVLDYPRGVCSVRVNATEVNGYNRRHLIVCGTEGTIEIRPLECPTLLRETLAADVKNNFSADNSREIFTGYMPGRYDRMMLEFAACIRGEKQNPYTAEYELLLQKVILQTCGIEII